MWEKRKKLKANNFLQTVGAGSEPALTEGDEPAPTGYYLNTTQICVTEFPFWSLMTTK